MSANPNAELISAFVRSQCANHDNSKTYIVDLALRYQTSACNTTVNFGEIYSTKGVCSLTFHELHS